MISPAHIHHRRSSTACFDGLLIQTVVNLQPTGESLFFAQPPDLPSADTPPDLLCDFSTRPDPTTPAGRVIHCAMERSVTTFPLERGRVPRTSGSAPVGTIDAYALFFACASDDANEYDVRFLLTNSNTFFITCDIL